MKSVWTHYTARIDDSRLTRSVNIFNIGSTSKLNSIDNTGFANILHGQDQYHPHRSTILVRGPRMTNINFHLISMNHSPFYSGLYRNFFQTWLEELNSSLELPGQGTQWSHSITIQLLVGNHNPLGLAIHLQLEV